MDVFRLGLLAQQDDALSSAPLLFGAVGIEDRVSDLTGVKEISSTVAEGAASVTVEFEEGYPIQEALLDVKREMDAIQDLPDDVDNIVVDILEPNMPAIIVAIYGDADERSMKNFIIQTRDDLLTLPEITDVQPGGYRQDELRVEARAASASFCAFSAWMSSATRSAGSPGWRGRPPSRS